MDRPGEVFPLSPLQAAVIGPQLDRLEEIGRVRLETVEFLQTQVNEQLRPWVWQSEIETDVVPSYYKVAWLAPSAEHRDRVIAAAQHENLPMGSGFRSMSRCSERRCAKPYPTPRSDLLGECLFVLDHRALMLTPSSHPLLAESLQRVATATR